MRRVLFTIVAMVVVGCAIGYASGLFTGETRREDSCTLCRATRFSGRHYGFPYAHVDNCVVTDWYRANIDPKHGLDPKHAHRWRQSGSTVTDKTGLGINEYASAPLPPMFLLHPGILRTVLEGIPDRETQIGLIHSLDVENTRVGARRVRLLIEYYYVDRLEMPWTAWWRLHGAEFGLEPPAEYRKATAGAAAK